MTKPILVIRDNDYKFKTQKEIDEIVSSLRNEFENEYHVLFIDGERNILIDVVNGEEITETTFDEFKNKTIKERKPVIDKIYYKQLLYSYMDGVYKNLGSTHVENCFSYLTEQQRESLTEISDFIKQVIK